MGLGNMSPGLIGIAVDSFEVTPHNSTSYVQGEARYLYVGGAGVVKLVKIDGVEVSYTVPAGAYILCASIRVNSTGTTATGIVAHK